MNELESELNKFRSASRKATKRVGLDRGIMDGEWHDERLMTSGQSSKPTSRASPATVVIAIARRPGVGCSAWNKTLWFVLRNFWQMLLITIRFINAYCLFNMFYIAYS